MKSGLLNVNKPPGITSFGVVAAVRRGAGIRKVGHAGTLDPAASGVLIVCLGGATRITEYLMDLPKTYRGVVRLGQRTTTDDAEGRVVAEGDWSRVTEDDVRRALAGFKGVVRQAPPAHSAVKIEGEAAYRRARRGEEVSPKARPVHIYRLGLLRFEPPDLEIEVECGRGTYIRSLARDLGEALGCGAHLASLVRTRVGPFRLEEACTLAELEEALARGDWQQFVLPVDFGLMHLPAVTLHFEDEKDLRHGQPFALDDDRAPVGGRAEDGAVYRAYAEDGSLAGLVRYDAKSGLWRPVRVFPPAEQEPAGG